ncbi:hypothetical protein [Alicyclobacillus fastidiosus]|uniref:hypothetical protein n=1 Tax=Alicyclobacillus fastidiosus TaxID=392011 RepID=UPI0023EA33BC|nr:hypothetical protein [Alicyclobacillus fastidiosus]GMA66023.1 hypothetical protein GCM10025859_64650 [Alicyclobacillus fastidiosus]
MPNNGQVVAEWVEVDGTTGETVYCEKVWQFGKMWTFRERFGKVPLSVCLKNISAKLGGQI